MIFDENSILLKDIKLITPQGNQSLGPLVLTTYQMSDLQIYSRIL